MHCLIQIPNARRNFTSIWLVSRDDMFFTSAGFNGNDRYQVSNTHRIRIIGMEGGQTALRVGIDEYLLVDQNFDRKNLWKSLWRMNNDTLQIQQRHKHLIRQMELTRESYEQ